MISKGHKIVFGMLASSMLAAALGLWLIITPGNPVTRLFSQPMAKTGEGERIITGPFPLESDFPILKKEGVTLIVSLLNPAIPYENILLRQEKELAAKYGIRVGNYPMSSILGQRFGKAYDHNARAAAAAVLAEPGKVYIHCYLGVHRAQVVAGLIHASGTSTGTYAVRKGERSEHDRTLELAQDEFDANRFEAAIAALQKLNPPSGKAQMLLAWSYYRTGKIQDARSGFEGVVGVPDLERDAKTGLGYCALRQSELGTAITLFSEVLEARADDVMALEGMGIALHHKGQAHSALQYLEKARKLDPRNPEILSLMERIKGKGPAPIPTE
jgi:Flp pilus assembly protein TadD